MGDVNALLQQWIQQFDQSKSDGVNAVFQIDSEHVIHHITVSEGECTLQEGEHSDPNVSLHLSGETLRDIMSGEQDGMMAFMSGNIQVDGDVMLAAKLMELFPAS